MLWPWGGGDVPCGDYWCPNYPYCGFYQAGNYPVGLWQTITNCCTVSFQVFPSPHPDCIPPTCSVWFSQASYTADASGTVTAMANWNVSTNATSGTYSCWATSLISANPSGGQMGTFSGRDFPITFSGIGAAGGTGSCSITACNAAGCTTPPCSGTVTLNPGLAITSFSLSPAPPAAAFADAAGNATVLATWSSTAASSASYTCDYGGMGGSIATSGTNVPLTFTNVTAPRVTPPTAPVTCWITVLGGGSSVSRSASVNLQPYKPTVVSLAFSPNPAGVLTPVTMSWSGNNTPTSYTLIRVDPPPLATVRSLSTMPLSLTEMPHEIGLIPGVYTFKVEACNGHPEGCGYSPNVEFTVTPASPVGSAWRVKDQLGNVLLTIDSQGNGIARSGLSVFENAGVPQGAVAGALVLKRRGTNVNVFVFSPAGLYFQGVVLEHQSQPTVSAIDGDDLVIRDSGRTPVARFDGATGNLYLRGHAVVGP